MSWRLLWRLVWWCVRVVVGRFWRVRRGIWGMWMGIGRVIRGLSTGVVIGRRLRGVGGLCRGFGDKAKESRKVSVVEAVERDLAAMRLRAAEVADSALAASALVLARELDKAKNSATSKSMCARALSETLEDLRELLPPATMKDNLDDLSSRRAKRLARGAAAEAAPCP